jgi:hypothetical protein
MKAAQKKQASVATSPAVPDHRIGRADGLDCVSLTMKAAPKEGRLAWPVRLLFPAVGTTSINFNMAPNSLKKTSHLLIAKSHD